jgi:rfaE bifunctional protein kinase chain/domain
MDGEVLEMLLAEKGIDTSGHLKSGSRITTNKARVMGRNQQMMRLDSETTRDLDKEEEKALLGRLEAYLEREKPQVMLFEDYNKGVLTDGLIRRVVELCRERGVITAVDPKRRNFFSYEGVTIFKPNLKEVREGLHVGLDDVQLTSLELVHGQLKDRLKHELSLITLSEKGVFYSDGRQAAIIPSHVRNIADVSGAGDTVIAVASLVYAATRDVRLMASIANIAGGLVCEDVGTVAISRERLLGECGDLLGPH